MTHRSQSTHRIEFASGSSLSQICDLREGYYGTIIVPVGSGLVGKSIQFVTSEAESMVASNKVMPAVGLLSNIKTLSEGANPLNDQETREVGPAGMVRIQLDSSVVGDQVIYLLWKS